MPLDLIIGNRQVRENLAAGGDLLELEKQWQPGLDVFDERRCRYFLYES